MTARYLTRIEPGPRLVITDTRPSSSPGCSEREWWMDLPCQLEWSRQRDLFGGITGSARLLVHGADRTESFAGTDDDLFDLAEGLAALNPHKLHTRHAERRLWR